MGLYKGCINITLEIIGLLLTIILIIMLYPYIYDFTSMYITNNMYTTIITYIITYVIFALVYMLILTKVMSLIKNTQFGTINVILGFKIGLLKSILIIISILIISIMLHAKQYPTTVKKHIQSTTIEDYPAWIKNSKTIEYLHPILQTIVKPIPSYIIEKLNFFANDNDIRE
ncbi:CvpA family protein [Rickettsia endosymbiont of Cardiosporidium cionae]|uniref:CvpA family protein n=1 Tax=Rickettsia endosymbiont of Cardiosporidium cionae TaxID=2777155 RepID=UPI001E62ACA0|nr:CvpA family protein [Rickettsia endosymbiont of Cardiosporidium cionae]